MVTDCTFFTDWKSIVENTQDSTNETLCLENFGNFYAHPHFAITMLVPVLLSTIFMIPHWFKMERSKKRLLKTFPLILLQIYPQMKMAEILFFALWKKDRKWKSKKEDIQKEIGSIGNSSQTS